MKTRAKVSTKSSKDEAEAPKFTTQKVQLASESSNPPHLFVVPEGVSKEARVVTLENPRYLTNSRYLVCPERGFYEFTKVGAPKNTPRSWLLSTQDGTEVEESGSLKEAIQEEAQKEEEEEEEEDNISKGYIMKTAGMFIATPADPLFLVLPALAQEQSAKGSQPEKKLFLSGEDYIDRIGSLSNQLRPMLRIDSVRTLLESRMEAVCDTVDAGDETMYRIKDVKVLQELFRKAQKIAASGLPKSMEEKFVIKALEVPMLSMKRDESFMHELIKGEEDAAIAESGLSTPATDNAESQTSISTTGTSFTEASTEATSFSSDEVPLKEQVEKPAISAPEGVADLLRLRTAFFFICSTYLQPHLATILKSLLSSPDTSPTDFTTLDTHLAHLAKLRQDAIAARSLSDMSRKRTLEDDEEDETRAEKKRKKDEEEKRKKAGESRGVKNLKKVNTVGMKKMSDFFKKKA